MSCREAGRLLDAHADGELDIPLALSVEEHLDACARCRRSYDGLQAIRAAVQRHAETPRAPEALRLALGRLPAPSPGARLASALRSPLALAAPGFVSLALAGWLVLAPPPAQAPAPLRVVFHISSSEDARGAMRNLGNHLQAAPGAKVVVVAHNGGVDFLLAGARDAAGRPFEEAVRDFRRRGVEFRICRNTLERRGLSVAAVVPEADLVPSGIAEIGRLQSREGFAYMRL